ncbi:hypothetical protein B0T26DRAFT_656440 [Lasiosphaeria miniovina]|uniref:Transposase n=1 Tax=Lasiosphaeria miniovina TaxID=1954250 RepID=A0AA40A0N4_9PEZI|nr:uncharacterized protein B0T26DRAFT_656440 [Lasiosphaeria miniovina]KAK0706884.1 hypothetical protein B0T26DRAFT_656440 [Lasiosphaeria miniovina]
MKLNLNEFAAELATNRSSNQELTPGMRAAICTLVAAGQSERSVATLFGVSRHAVTNSIELWKTQRPFDFKAHSGRPEALRRAEKRYIILLVKKNRDLAKKLSSTP